MSRTRGVAPAQAVWQRGVMRNRACLLLGCLLLPAVAAAGPPARRPGRPVLLAAAASGDRLDLAVLAVLDDRGRPVFERVPGGGRMPLQQNCQVIRRGARFRVVAPVAGSPLRITEAPFSNEANRCIGHPKPPPALKGRHLLAVANLPTDPVVAVAEKAPARLEAVALEAIARSSGQRLVPRDFRITTRQSAWRHGRRVYHVVEARLAPQPGCVTPACRHGADLGGRGLHRAVVVVEALAPNDLAVRYTSAQAVTRADPPPPVGLVSFAGFVAPRGAPTPWLVLYWDGGPEWEFELVGPGPQPDGPWRSLLFGAAATTI